MIVIDFTSQFKRNVRQLSRRYRSIKQDLDPIIEQLKAGETPGDQVSGVGHTVYKAPVKNSDNRKGKSGGYRVLYYVVTDNGAPRCWGSNNTGQSSVPDIVGDID